MNLIDLEKLAKDHKPCPETANPADLCYYWTMRSIYDGYRARKVSADEAKTAKRQAAAQHSFFSKSLENAFEACRFREDAVRKLGGFRTEIRKASDIENKYRIALKAITAMTGENVTENTEVKWIESVKQKDKRAEG